MQRVAVMSSTLRTWIFTVLPFLALSRAA